MVIAAGFNYGPDGDECVLIDLDKLPSDSDGIAFKKSIQRAIAKHTPQNIGCVIRYEIAQSSSLLSAIVEPPQKVEAVVNIYVE